MHAYANQTKQFLNLNQIIFFTKPRPIYKSKPKHPFNQNQSILEDVPTNMGIKLRLLYRLCSMRDYFIGIIFKPLY